MRIEKGINEMLSLEGKTQVRAEDAIGKTVASVHWHEADTDANLAIFFTDGTYLLLCGGENRGGSYLTDDYTPPAGEVERKVP